MDNLTHSLIGAIIGQSGLKRLSGLGMPTLIIAANIPDIDAGCSIYGIESLAMRRGLTHGPIALLLLPFLLTVAMVAWDRWQTRRGKRPADRLPLKPLPLFLLALIGTLSHPAFDWLNNYGVRLLEPFSHQWFYGDSLFIIDLWIWLGLGFSLWLSRRKERQQSSGWARPAQAGLAGLIVYVLINAAITRTAESDVREELTEAGVVAPLVVASLPPLMFWKRDVFWRSADRYGSAQFDPLSDGTSELDSEGAPHHMADPRIAATARQDAPLAAFLFWARMPVARFEGGDLVVTDQRYANPLVADRFTVRAPLAPADGGAGQGR